MNKIDQLILVDNNHTNTSSIVKALEESGSVENIKVAVNGEHALLCLDHLDLYKRMKGKRVMVILNTTNSIDFLEGYKWKKYPSKEELLIVVTDSSTKENIDKARLMGAFDVLSTPLKTSEIMDLAERHFEEKAPKERVIRRKIENRQLSA